MFQYAEDTNEEEFPNEDALTSSPASSPYTKKNGVLKMARDDNDIGLQMRDINNKQQQGNSPFIIAIPNKVNIDEDPNIQDGSNLHYRKLRKAASQYDLKMPGMGRPLSFIRSDSYAASMGAFSHRSDHTAPSLHPASSDKEKSKMTRRYFATVFAISYAIFLVVFGAIVFVGDAIVSQYPLGEAFCIYMLTVSFIYFIFLYIDIRVHVWKAKRALKAREIRHQMYAEQLTKMNINFNGPMELNTSSSIKNFEELSIPELNLPPIKAVSHKYCFMTGRHGEFLYLKLGAAWFAFGLLIHSILQIAYQIIFFTSDENDRYHCASGITLALDIIFPIYSLFVLFFIFKYMNVIINEYRGLARLLLMHAIGTSLAFWIYTIVRETADAIAISTEEYEDHDAKYNSSDRDVRSFNDELYRNECLEVGNLNFIRRTFSPYLYPFIIEYCILIVGIFFIMWQHISHCPKKLAAAGHKQVRRDSVLPDSDVDLSKINSHVAASTTSSLSDNCGTHEADHDIHFKSHAFIYADCHATHRGLFGGLVLVVVTIVFIILFFVAVSNEDYLYTGILVNHIFELSVLVVMIIAVIIAYLQTIKLDINHHPMSVLDDILLFIAIPAFFSETIFSMVPAIYYGTPLNICIAMGQLIQVLIQTPFIIDGLRRCANSSHLRHKKPGRELIMFLTIANVSLWIYYTFSVKTAYTGDKRYIFYGYTVWSILNHVSLPLIMFYRFHASVCLVDMWRHSYEPEQMSHH